MHHRSILILTNTKHELLFEAGLRAINDYYLREGVTSIAASLERFYEFGVKVIFENLDNELLFESIWKEVKNQSERQIGAFLYSYTLIFSEKPKILSQKMSEFRNKVVHKGYFPSIEETIQFVKEVREIFAIVDEKLSAKFEKQREIVLKKKMESDLIEAKKKHGEINKKFPEHRMLSKIVKIEIDTFFNQAKFNSDVESYLKHLKYDQPYF